MNHLSTEFSPKPELDYPFEKGWHPEIGQPFEVADGVFWLRVPLPYALDHINLWLLRDGNGWTIVDSGVDASMCKQAWERVFEEFLQPFSVNRIIVTHYHPDHIGLAAWLSHRCDCPILITQGEFDRYRQIVDRDHLRYTEQAERFIAEFGFSKKVQDMYVSFFSVDEKPEDTRVQYSQCEFISDRDEIEIDGRAWQVVMGNGHSPEHACLYNPAQKLLISGDQVIARISSNISVYVANRDEDPLSDWLDSCQRLQDYIAADTLVLPAHQEPFIGIGPRLQQLMDDHHAQLNRLRLVSSSPVTVKQMTRVLFDRELSAAETLMAASETLSHINYLLVRGELNKSILANGTAEYRSPA